MGYVSDRHYEWGDSVREVRHVPNVGTMYFVPEPPTPDVELLFWYRFWWAGKTLKCTLGVFTYERAVTEQIPLPFDDPEHEPGFYLIVRPDGRLLTTSSMSLEKAEEHCLLNTKTIPDADEDEEPDDDDL